MLKIERDRLATDIERCRTAQHLVEEENEELRDQLTSSHQAINQLLVEVSGLLCELYMCVFTMVGARPARSQ